MRFLFFLFACSFFSLEGAEKTISLEDVTVIFPSEAAKAKKDLETLSPEQMDADWKLNEYFGSVVTINLPRCPERLVSITEKFREIGCKQFDIFKGIDGRVEVPEWIWQKFYLNWGGLDLSTEEGKAQYDTQRKGEAGCYLSHYNVIKGIKENFDKALKSYLKAVVEKNEDTKKTAYKDLLKYRSVLIVEDDTGFGLMNDDRMAASIKDAGKAFYHAMSEIPDEWDMFYFMTYCRSITPNETYTPHLAKVNAGFSAIAYAVNHLMYDSLLQTLSAIEDPKNESMLPIDSVYAEIHQKHRCYAVIPSIAYQKIGVSEINSLIIPELIQFQPISPL